MRGWFTGYALLIPFFFGNALAQALFAVPCAIASRFSRKAGAIAWLVTVVVLVVAVVAYIDPFSKPKKVGIFDVLLAIIVVGPQALAYPLVWKRPTFVIAVAFGIGLAVAITWVVLGTLSGSTPD